MAHVFCNRVHNDPSRSSKVINFGTNRKRVYDVLFDLNSNLGPILPRFRELLYAKSHFLDTPALFQQKFWSVPVGVDLRCWGLQTANTAG